MLIKRLIQQDARISEKLRVAEKPGAQRNFAVLLAHSGDSWLWVMALVLLWSLGNSFWKQWAVIMLGAISVLAGLVISVKFIIGRRRPEGEWGSIYRNTDPHSFPSGHAARAFLMAVLASGLGPPWAAVTLWVWAPLVSLARVAMGVHYVSDVVAGLMVGVAAGLIVIQFHQQFLTWLVALITVPLW